MKRIILLLILGISTMFVNAQKENGIVYSEHDAINKTKALWAAFIKGDKETYLSFYADSVWNGNNGKVEIKTKNQIAGMMDWWNKEFKNLAIVDDKPAFPDAIQYKEGGLFVQDWLKITGTHDKSGINLNEPFHNVYRFDENGKINLLLQYSDNKIIDEINNSQKTIENGTVYINHPYIVTVRKLVNAFCAENITLMKEFYAPDCIFTGSDYKMGETINLDTKMKNYENTFANYDNLTLTQFGYPDCIYYQKDDNYTVYSWWSLSCINTEGKKFSKIPVKFSHTFNKDGKVSIEILHLNSTHFQ